MITHTEVRNLEAAFLCPSQAADPLSKTRRCQSACMASDGQFYSIYDECGFFRAKSSSTYISWEEMLLAVSLSKKTIKAARVVHRAVKVQSPCSRDKEAENTCRLADKMSAVLSVQGVNTWVDPSYLLVDWILIRDCSLTLYANLPNLGWLIFPIIWVFWQAGGSFKFRDQFFSLGEIPIILEYLFQKLWNRYRKSAIEEEKYWEREREV